MGAGISVAAFKPVERSVYNTALAAGMAMAEPDRHNVLKARRIIGEPLEKLADRKLAGEVVLFHWQMSLTV
jgi:hypothetical protein